MSALPIVHGRRLGHVPDRPDPRDHDAAPRLRTVKAAPKPTSAENYDLCMVVDQFQLGSCTCNAVGQDVRGAQLLELVEKARAAWASFGNDPSKFDAAAALARAQEQIEFWSRLFAYYLARSYTHDTGEDTGTEIRTVFRAINHYGFVAESVWPYSDNTDPNAGPVLFSKPIPANVYRLAFDARDSAKNEADRLIDYERISSTGDALIEDVKSAVIARHHVAFGTPVSEAFCSDMSGNGGRPIDPPTNPSDQAGGHAMTIIGYDPEGAWVLNSWGKEYGGKAGLPPGVCRFSWDYVVWSQTTDFWIAARAPFFAPAGA